MGSYDKKITGASDVQRIWADSVFAVNLDHTPHSCRQIVMNNPISSFCFFIDEPMLRSIQKYTTMHVRSSDINYDLDLNELEKFIGLQLARG